MKKRIFAMLLIVVMLLMTACGGSDEEVSGHVEAPAETQAPEENLSLGRLNGGVYTNKYTGYGCTLDSSWSIYSAEELQQMPDIAKEAMEGSELAEAIDTMSQFTDIMAENVDQLLTFNVLYQKLGTEERMANAILSEKDMIEGVLGMQDQMIDAYAQAGITVKSMEAVEITFLGKTRTALHTSTDMQGVPYYILQIFDRKLGSHSVTLTLGSYVEDNTMSMLELFYTVE